MWGMRISHKGGDRPSLSGTAWIRRTHPEISAVYELSGLDLETLAVLSLCWKLKVWATCDGLSEDLADGMERQCPGTRGKQH